MTDQYMHRKLDPGEPIYVLMAEIIDSINLHIRAWEATKDMPKEEIRQAIASALMAEATHYHGNTWGCSKEQFIQMAEEEWEIRCTPEANGGLQ